MLDKRRLAGIGPGLVDRILGLCRMVALIVLGAEDWLLMGEHPELWPVLMFVNKIFYRNQTQERRRLTLSGGGLPSKLQ